MANVRSSDLLRQVRTLFGAGTVTGLSDAQLLERFTSRSARAAEDTLAAEAAFEVLVARHGPMVLGVCRRALADPADVEDAFQATFLVLVRRAGSVRVGDSLGRWLYGVSRRVASKARARSQRARRQTIPIEGEPVVPEPAADQAGLLAALDDEVNRLPEKYRAPVVLCHLEGLSHAEAAERLHWPVGTVSGRISRARGLLKDRLVRRGLAPAENSLGMLLASDAIRAVVPEKLGFVTVRAAMSGPAQAGAALATAMTLTNEVLRAAVAVKLRAAAAVVLSLVLAGAVAAGAGIGSGAGKPAGARAWRQGPSGPSRPAAIPSASHRPADEIVKEIEALLNDAKRAAFLEKEWYRQFQAREQAAGLIDELWTAYPDDPRLTRYLPERWECLPYLYRKAEIDAEIAEVLRTAKHPALKKEALLFETCLRFLYEPIDGDTAVSLAEAFARQAPGDPRAGELLYLAAGKLDDASLTREGLVVFLAVAGALTLWMPRIRRAGTHRWLLKFGVGLAGLVPVLLVALLFTFQFLSYDRQTAIFGFFSDKLNALKNPAWQRRAAFSAHVLWNWGQPQLQSIVWSGRTGLALALASATACFLVVARRRFVGVPTRWPSTVRLAVLGFVVVMAVSLALDAFRIARQGRSLRDRIVAEHPDFFKDGMAPRERRERDREARLAEGQRKQRERLGEPFELEFADAITGRRISIKALRGKVVVVDFWASDGGLFAERHIAKMKVLYAEYHDKGVELIGVSVDRPDQYGGLDALKAFVVKQQIPWPQYHDSHLVVSRPGPADRLLARVHDYLNPEWDNSIWRKSANDFSESWGIRSLPVIFLVDAEGKLYSAEAEGELDKLIPRLVAKAGSSSFGR